MGFTTTMSDMGRGLRILKFLGLAIGIIVLIFVWESLPIISGYGAKVVCSGVFVAGREKTDVVREDLASFPISLASCTVDGKDSSVTASVWGLARRKAIYRMSLGATLVSGLTEEEIRRMRMDRVEPAVDPDTVDWPAGDRGVMGNLPGMDRVDTGRMKTAVGLAFGQGAAVTGTRAVVVVYRGKIVMERYAPGFGRFTRLAGWRSEEHTSELQSHSDLVCRLLLETKQRKNELQSHGDLVYRLMIEKKKKMPKRTSHSDPDPRLTLSSSYKVTHRGRQRQSVLRVTS